MTVKERLKSFIKYKKIGQKKFAQMVGLSNGYVNAIRVSIQPDTLHKIAMCFPELNTGWIMTGEGEMLRNTSSEIAVSKKIVDDGYKDKYLELLEKYTTTLEELTELQKKLAKDPGGAAKGMGE